MEKILESINTKLLADNLLKARDICGKTVKEASTSIGIPLSRLKNYEKGKYVPSLPELESLSFLYRIPLYALLSEKLIDNFIHDPDAEQIKKLIEIRQRLIGTRFQLAREKKELTFKKLSEICGLSTAKIKRYESGETPIPLDDLINLKQSLDIDPAEIMDCNSPIGNWQRNQTKIEKMVTLPEEISSFVDNPENHQYITIAGDLADIGLEKLKNLANSLLEITGNSSSDTGTFQK